MIRSEGVVALSQYNGFHESGAGGGGVGSEGSRVHNNVINMIIAKEQTEFVDNKEKSTPLVVLIRIKIIFQLQL